MYGIRGAKWPVLVCATAAILLSTYSHESDAADEDRPALQLANADLSAIRRIARTYPCAALALLQIRNAPRSRTDESLYLEWIPDSESVLWIIDEFGAGRVGSLVAATQRSPYSSSQTYVKVAWHAARPQSGPGATVFTAELVGLAGESLQPRHVLEAVTLAASAGNIRSLPEKFDGPFLSL